MIQEVKKRVLVVDDDDDVLAYLSTWLSDQGFDVDIARDGDEAAAMVKQRKPDLITLDVVMPQKTGLKFYRELKKNSSLAKIPVIVISGLQSEYEKFIFKSRSAAPPDAFVAKPFKQEELGATINRILGASPARAANSE